jgi:hypothetical protein
MACKKNEISQSKNCPQSGFAKGWRNSVQPKVIHNSTRPKVIYNLDQATAITSISCAMATCEPLRADTKERSSAFLARLQHMNRCAPLHVATRPWLRFMGHSPIP